MSPSARRTTCHPSPGLRAGSAGVFEGRLRYPTGHGERTVIVQCHPTEEGFAVHLPAFNEAANYLYDAHVVLTSVGVDQPLTLPDLSGRSHVVADADIDPSSAAALEQWPDNVPARYFVIVPEPDSPTAAEHRPGHPATPHDLEGGRHD